MNCYLIIVAAGTGSRLNKETPKQYLRLGNKTILERTLSALHNAYKFEKTCIVIAEEHQSIFKEKLNTVLKKKDILICTGGKTRKDSVLNGLKSFSNIKDEDIVLIHDAARPFVKSNDIKSLIKTMENEKAATLATPITDTLRSGIVNKALENNVNRENLWSIQTPQAFRYATLLRAHEKSTEKAATDDTMLVSYLGIPVKIVEGSKENFKITHEQDLILAQKLVESEYETRSGTGFDVHAFDNTDAKSVRLGGIDIPHNKKLKGHSDADVALHTITDALLGAIGEGDIGLHFPPSNNDFKDMDSAVFLKHTNKLLQEKGAKIINIDLTIICEAPKIGPHRDKMKARIAEILNINENRINIKGTTTEKLGFTGREEGIAAQAIANVKMPRYDN